MPTNKNEHLNCVLSSHKMRHIQSLVDKHKTKRDELKIALEKHYKSGMYAPINSGSYAKHTAINIKFDLDIVAPFTHTQFASLKIMFEEVFHFFNFTYKPTDSTLKKVRKQGVSIGLIFEDQEGDILDIDVVPGREVSIDDYPETKRLNLYVNRDGQHSIQTNIEAQINHIKGKNAERECIRLLKIWKVQKGKRIKSFFIELITIRAFKNTDSIPSGIWNKLKMVMEYIKDYIEIVRLVDPGNSNNVVSNTLTNEQKRQLARDMKVMLDAIDKDSDNIKLYFKVNERFPCNTYNRIGIGAATLSTTSFG